MEGAETGIALTPSTLGQVSRMEQNQAGTSGQLGAACFQLDVLSQKMRTMYVLGVFVHTASRWSSLQHAIDLYFLGLSVKLFFLRPSAR